jgi:hypothetical protein
MTDICPLLRSRRGSAAAEMALVLPLLLVILFGAVELGNYFMNEHILVKAVRDGARFAARQNFTNYDDCTGSVDDPVLTETRNVVMKGLVAGGFNRIVNWDATTIDVTMDCQTAAGGETMSGIYKGRPDGAPLVTVSARVPYTPVLAEFGFRGAGLSLNASQQAAVMGI